MDRFFKPEGARIHTPENREYLATPQGLERAMREGAIVEGTVTLCDSRLCLHVDLGCAEGLLAAEDAVYCREGERRKDIAIISRVGKPIAVRILALERRGGRTVARLSRRLAQESCMKHLLATLRAGDVIPARVTHLEPFGAFLDIGCGVSSLLSVDCISVSRIAHPRDRLRCGMELFVAIKSIDRESGRIYTTLRELLGTWEENAAAFEAGQTVTGIIRSVESYGVFVELTPNLAGLCEPATGLRPGQQASVFIKNLIPEKMKVKLILIDAFDAGYPAEPLRYFVSGSHIDRWRYSPDSCPKTIGTVFSEP